MSANSNTQPPKSILKTKPPPDTPAPTSPPPQTSKGRASDPKNPQLKFDEMNIIQTLHPADKDYGFDVIDEAKTPYSLNRGSDGGGGAGAAGGGGSVGGGGARRKTPYSSNIDVEESEDVRRSSADSNPSGVDAGLLSKMLSDKAKEPPKATQEPKKTDAKDNGTDGKNAEFEAKRKAHYDEFQAVKSQQKKDSGDKTNK